ncbi:hypothetical protein BLSTO_06321 [Blastocystis sp. subtype 1]
MEFCTKTLQLNNAIIFILNKLYDLYLKKSIPVKNISLSQISEQAVLNNYNAYCLLFNLTGPVRARLLSASSIDSKSHYDARQEELDAALREEVKAMKEKNPECTLEDVDQELSKAIDVAKV